MIAADHDEGVHVIRHHDEGVNLDVDIVSRKGFQLRVGYKAQARQYDPTVHDFAEDRGAISRTHGYEIPTTGAIIPISEARRLDAVLAKVKRHDGGTDAIISCLAAAGRDVASNVSTTVLFWNHRL